jgi:hypothetical protein
MNATRSSGEPMKKANRKGLAFFHNDVHLDVSAA